MSAQDDLSLEDVISDPDTLKEKIRAARGSAKHSTNASNGSIRLHRAHSWYGKAMALAQDQEASREFAEARLIMLWVAFSAVAGRWDAEKGQPVPETKEMHRFLDAFVRMAGERLVSDFIGRHKSVLRRLLANKFLRLDFWKNPFDAHLPDAIEASGNLLQQADDPKTARLILKEALYRIFILRGQLVHGASTAGSKLNREALADALSFLQDFIPLVIQVCLERGLDHEWPPLCFPPIDSRQKEQLERMTDRN